MNWALREIRIEGLRGINNEGDPLTLKFKPDAINSVFAPNAVGKSSIYDALLFAIRGSIPKLDKLPYAERPKDYYKNRFHSTGQGFIELGLKSVDGDPDCTIRVALGLGSKRHISSTNSPNPEEILASLDREFALLDYQTFRQFLEDNPTDRGRSFAGLLGLHKYSIIRQFLQALTNTLAFNNTFGTAVTQSELSAAGQTIAKSTLAARKTAAELLSCKPEDFTDLEDIATKVADHLVTTAPIGPLCAGKSIGDIDFDCCVTTILSAEGGEKKQQYMQVLEEHSALTDLNAKTFKSEQFDELASKATAWEDALAQTSGDAILAVLQATEKVLASPEWENKALCPACGEEAGKSVLEYVQAQLQLFESVQTHAKSLSDHIVAIGYVSNGGGLERRLAQEGEPKLFGQIRKRADLYTITLAEAKSLRGWHDVLISRLHESLADVVARREKLEKELPPSLVAVTKKVEDARQINASIEDAKAAEAKKLTLQKKKDKVERLSDFLAYACETFATAEGAATKRRMEKVLPLSRNLFSEIMSDDVVPGIVKSDVDESVALRLDSFFGKQGLSALALLSESYRNAFAISIYLAAASLFGGAAKFVILDDVTSSFDGGHQFFLMEAIRTMLARPEVPDGLQVIILSHDTLLEKLFNKNAQKPGWNHQRIEGNPRFLVLPTVGADAKIRAQTQKYLAAGNVSDAAPGLRMTLEAKLIEIMSRLQIPVPLDFAIDDTKKMAGNAIKHIENAIKLHTAAGDLVMSPNQVSLFSTNVMTIVANFLSHYATGSSSAFTAPALTQVLKAIDDLPACFQTEDPPGSGQMRYYKSLSSV